MILETATRNAMLQAIADAVDAGAGAGTLVFETVGDAAIVTITLDNPNPFDAPAAGSMDVASTTLTSSAAGTELTCAQASFFDGDSAKVLELSVAVTGSDIDLSSLLIAVGEKIDLTSLSITQPAS